MSDQDEALARRWMASKHWGGWRAGMVGRDPQYPQFETCFYQSAPEIGWSGYIEGYGPHKPIPDLDHPGTRAFLLEDVRRAWGEDGNFASYSEFGAIYWSLDPAAGDDWKRADTEAAALIAALESAP